MKKIFFLFFILISVFSTAQDSTRVLFIGNSITYFNGMPQTFEDIANSLGDKCKVTMYAPGGTGFVNHVSDPNVYNYLREGKWDYIVLQPGSNESPGYSFPINQTLQHAKSIIDSAYKYNPCSKVLFYEISYGIWGNSPTDVSTYNTTMDLIKNNLEYLSDSTKSFFAPVGEAFRTKWNNNPNDILWGSFGDIHPNAKGSYMAACVFYSTIFQKPSLPSHIRATLSPLEADSLQLLCDTLVLNNFSSWRINTFNQITDFNSVIAFDTVSFTNNSQNIDSVLWDFGDGSYSTENNPVHNYSITGSYIVVLTTYSHGCDHAKVQVVDIIIDNVISSKKLDNWRFYPNPVNDILTIHNYNKSFTYSYTIFNMFGQMILYSNNDKIDVSLLKSGQYIIQYKSETNVSTKRFIKN